MKKIFDENLVANVFRPVRGAAGDVVVRVYTESYYSSSRRALVVEHRCAVEGGTGGLYPSGNAVFRAMQESTWSVAKVKDFAVRHLKTVDTKCEAIRLSVKSADDYRERIAAVAEEAWKKVSDIQEQNHLAQKAREEAREEEEARHRAAGHLRHITWPCNICGALEGTWCEAQVMPQ